MTVFAGGWMCPGCWTQNRGRDRRCIGCRRELATVAGEAAEAYRLPERVTHDAGRLPRPVGFLVVTVGVIWILYAVATVVSYAAIVVWMVMQAAQAGAVSSAVFAGVAGAVIGLIVVGFAWLYYKLGMKIIDGARWAWLVGFLLTGGPLIFILLLVSQAPPSTLAVLPGWFGLSLVPSAYMAAVLLLAVLIDLMRAVIPSRR